ncbi:MAG: hypothetical protein IKD70_06515 [Eggerthellaceae bacterium]|nr:hypothetical protein [Eggerthellaceae bacterium]
MPEVTFSLRFTCRGLENVYSEEQVFLALSDAWDAVRLFAEPDSAELYTHVELSAHNWAESTDTVIFSMDFAEPYSW